MFPIKSPGRPFFVAGIDSLSCVALMLIWPWVIRGYNPMKKPSMQQLIICCPCFSLLMPFLFIPPDFGPGP
jgi:hypothetical protein